jgi:hypothetical protein
MGGGCSIAGTWRDSFVAVIRTADGQLGYGAGSSAETATAAAPGKCGQWSQMGCQVLHLFSSRTKKYNPKPAIARKHFAAAAVINGWPKNTPLWIATGAQTGEGAKQNALSSCRQENPGKECVTVSINENGTIANGVIQTFRTSDGGNGAVAENSLARAQRAAANYCTTLAPVTCTLTAHYPSNTPKLIVHDVSTGMARK